MKNSVFVLFAILFAGQAWGEVCVWNGTTWDKVTVYPEGVSAFACPQEMKNQCSQCYLNANSNQSPYDLAQSYNAKYKNEQINVDKEGLVTSETSSDNNGGQGNEIAGSTNGGTTGGGGSGLPNDQNGFNNCISGYKQNEVTPDAAAALCQKMGFTPNTGNTNGSNGNMTEQQAQAVLSQLDDTPSNNVQNSNKDSSNQNSEKMSKADRDKYAAEGEKQLKKNKNSASGGTGSDDITQKHEGKYGGNYGGWSTETTQVVNQGSNMLLNGLQTSSANQVALTGQTQNTQLQQRQMAGTATYQDSYNAQAASLEATAKQNSNMALYTAGVAVIQGSMGVLHQASVKTVNAKAGYAYGRIKAQKTTATGSNAINLAQQYINTSNNQAGEVKAQQQAAVQQAALVALDTVRIANYANQAKQARELAANLKAQGAAATGPQFTIGNNNPMANPTPDQAALTTPGAVVASDDTTSPDLPTSGDAFNPDLPAGPMAGQSPSQGGMGAPATPQGDSGSGLASAGGTSAANDEKKADTAALSKNAEGTYSPSDDAGSKFSRAGGMGGGSGVGVDNSFADLLKKFLPGGDDEKKGQDNLSFGSDRSPASDQAAVLGRNQNIFEAIHKRYEKKQAEGAIIFAGEKS